MPTLRFFNTLLLLFPALLCFSGIATAAEQTYVREYTYQANKLDTKESSRAMALQEVKRALLNELGTHVSSIVRVSASLDGSKYATEEVETLSAGVTKIVILDEKWDSHEFYIKAKIQADPDDV